MATVARLDFEVVHGDTFRKTLTFEQPAGVPLDLTDYTLLAQIKLYAGDLDTPQAEFEILDGSAVNKKILRLSAEIVATLKARNYWWDFQWIPPSGDTETKLQGIFDVLPQASVPT